MTGIIKNRFEEIWKRIKQETPLKNLTELAEITGITQSGLSKAKSRGDFSASWAYAVGKKYGLLTEWIMTGDEPKRLKKGIEINPLLVDVNEWLNEGRKHESAEFRILFEQQMIRAFFDYEEWKRKRDETEGGESKFPTSKVA
jgi:hypothetical protein